MKGLYADVDREMLPLKLKAIVEQELYEGERIRWIAQPKAGRMILGTVPIVLFGIPWTAFAIFWMWGASGGGRVDDAPGPFKFFFLFGVPFVLIGFGLLLSPLFAMLKAKGTVYVVTDQRAIIFEKCRGTNIKSYVGEMLRDMRKIIRPDGSGDIIFESYLAAEQDDRRGRRSQNVGFFGIQNVNEIEDMLKTLAQSNEKT